MREKLTYVSLMADESIHPKYEGALESVRARLGRPHPLYIGDEKVTSEAGEFVKTSPFDTRITIGKFQRATAEHVEEAVKEAKRAFGYWSRTSWKERLDVMRRVMELIEKDMYELAALMTYEVGKNRFEAVAEVFEALDFFSYYISLVEERKGFVTEMRSPVKGEEPVSVLRPYGVFFVISPWNFPLMLLNNMAAGALLAGNTVVMKPSSDSPLTAVKLYETYVEAGIPPGVVNLVTGQGSSISEAVVKNKDIDGLAFTGSKEVGLYLYREFAANQPWPKPVITEMGGKNAVIVSEKADVEKAVTGVMRAAFGYQGQKCSATSRVYVHKKVKDEFVKKLVEKTSELKVGDPRKRENFVGPLINKAALEKFVRSVEEVKRGGGRIRFGGEVLDWGEYQHGYYVQPTVVTDLPTSHELYKVELFVPILLVASYDSLDEAIGMANDSEYGLTAGIFSEDSSEVEPFFEKIEAGVCYANRRGGATTGAWPGAQSFVGWKASGSTGKGVGGPYYLLQFMREQSRTVVRES